MVYFVGAGSGAKDLITVRGMKLLEKADIIIYAGSLVNPELLEYAKPSCKIYNSATLTLEEVLSLMYKAEEEGLMTVRLHTGDGSLFGAIREQMDALDIKGISYETVPGVSACFGASSSLNLEFTLPDISQSLIICRMEGKTGVPPLQTIKDYAKHRASMAIYLSTGLLDGLVSSLIEGGYETSTPCALVYKATWDDEKSFITTIKDLKKVAEENNITKTAIILVGDFINHTNYSKSKLYDKTFETEFRKVRQD